jgi:hypothetical protein
VQITDLLAERHSPHRRLPRRFLPLALVALLVALLPLATVAAGFTDLNTDCALSRRQQLLRT